MFAFPIGNGNAGFNDFVEKFTNNADSGFPKIQQREVFYSVKNGNWNDINVWQTASGRVGKLPTANDDVYIRNIVTLTGTANITVNYFCNNLFISGTLSYTSIGGNNTINLYVNGNIRSLGTIDLRVASVTAILTLLGTDNYISNLVTNSTGIFNYGRNGDQDILDLPYSNLTITGTGVKKPTNNLVVSTLNVGSSLLGLGGILDLWWWDLTVLGNTVIGAFGTNSIRKSYFGNILFVGGVNFSNQDSGCDFSAGSPNVEFRGGFGIGYSNPNAGAIRSGTGVWTFSTNNQTIRPWSTLFPINLDCPIIISGAITVSLTQGTGTGGALNLNNTINGNSASSTLVVGTGSILTFATAASVLSMTTGVFDRTTFANTVAYSGNYSATIPFGTFHNLTISGTGIKTLGGNTTAAGSVSIGANATLECSNFNYEATGQTSVAAPGSFKKSGSGSIIFGGLFIFAQAGASTIDFSGNPTIECRNGVNAGFYPMTFISGTGVWSFTTNNQSYKGNANRCQHYGDVLIVGNIILTLTEPAPAAHIVIHTTINGTTAGSTLLLQGGILFTNITPSMTTGVFNTNPTHAGSGIAYVFNGDFTLPYTDYGALWVGGTGIKTLSGDTTINKGLRLGSNLVGANVNTILECLGFNLSVLGIHATTFGTSLHFSTISKSGSGNLLFVFGVEMGAGSTSSAFNFTGNPTVEFRGGLTMSAYPVYLWNCGTGTWSFTTNNQTIVGGNAGYSLNAPILISGAITVTHTNPGGNNVTINGTLNGNNALSKFDNRATNLSYKNAAQPMATGLLETNAAANTFRYDAVGNQNVKGGTYRTLNFGGSGVKTLQGNITVPTATYSVTGTATVNLNGFTITFT